MWYKIMHFAARAPRPDAVFDLIYDKAMRLERIGIVPSFLADCCQNRMLPQ